MTDLFPVPAAWARRARVDADGDHWITGRPDDLVANRVV